MATGGRWPASKRVLAGGSVQERAVAAADEDRDQIVILRDRQVSLPSLFISDDVMRLEELTSWPAKCAVASPEENGQTHHSW
jgi:hypothetical protein